MLKKFYNSKYTQIATYVIIVAAIIIAINEVNIVILKGTQKEYWLLVAAKSPWNKIFANPKDWNPLIAYEKIKITKVINREIIDKANPNEIHFAILLI